MRFCIPQAVFIMAILMAGCASEGQHSQKSETDPERAKDEAAIAALNAKDPILSDEILIHRFQLNRQTFEELRQMILSDSGLCRVDVDWTDPKNPADVGVSPKRIAEYRRLLTKVGCRRGFSHYPGRPGIYFISGTSGLAIGGTSKEYCYLESVPDSVATNTATYKPPDPNEDYEVCHLIEGNWCIYFDSF
jgi:hypothetical protein